MCFDLPLPLLQRQFCSTCSLRQTMSRDVDTLRHVDNDRRHATGRRRRFVVRSLGWTVLDAGVEWTALDVDDRSMRSHINRSIDQLSLGRRDVTDAVGRWGDVRYVTLCYCR